MKSGATETAYVYLSEHYQFPDNVFVSHLPEEIKKSNHPYKILWAHHAYDQPVFVNFDHHTVSHIVSPSQWNKDQLVKYHNVPEYKISVIPNGVADIFSYSDKKTKTMIYTSIPYKGLEVLARIIPKIHQVHPDAKFKIFSSMSLYGPSNDQFINLYDHLKTLPYVEYSAAVDQAELVPHYQEAAFFIHPNIWEETFCVSMVEAMKSGAYPIITNIGALAEVAGENNASVVPIDGTPTSKGYQVTEDFMNSFADACCLALDYYDKEQEYYHKVSKIISDQVSEKYNWKRVAEQWETLISNIQNNQIDTPPVYYCMVSTHNSEEYTDLAINSFFRNTQFREQDKFFLIDNDGKYQLTQNRDKITIISNHQPKTFGENMNFVMKLAFIDKSDFFGLNNDLFFTENWNKNFGTRKSISVPLCNQKLTGEFGDLKIKSAMNIDDFGGKENELNEFVKGIDPQKLNIDKQILGFHCFHIPYEVLSKVGFFDEKFVNGAEDIDYRLRAYDLGFDMDVNCSSYLLHFYGKSTWRSGETKDSTLTREKNYRKYFEKKWGKSVSDQLLAKSSVT
jgi:glycosyltransferase involved in cell wall biosynthesis/GT2 family glycosyltransferase